MAGATPPEYSLVVPVYNEEETLPELLRRLASLLDRMDGECEVILVDDGSSDRSFELVAAACGTDARFKLLRLSRNFGHQIAVTAGLDAASGAAVIVMDADLQDPPEVALDLAARWREGFDVVYAVREERPGDSRFKRATAKAFYRVFRRLTDVDVPIDVGDFRLVDRRALDAFRSMRETNRYVRGMFSWIGFRQVGVPFRREERFAGETKYPLGKMVKFATDGIVSFSAAPLRLALNIGFVVSGLSFLLGGCSWSRRSWACTRFRAWRRSPSSWRSWAGSSSSSSASSASTSRGFTTR
jgi:glycosyltransferase involved in cell wall biosynthesis